jgi:hypothetical protein
MDNDANGCFDRIVPVLALITCQALGETLTSCQRLRPEWHDMQHHVKFGSWVSNDTYPKDWMRNQYGSGQDSFLAPLLWVIMSTTIYNMLDNIPVKATLHHEDGISANERNVDGVVDDDNDRTSDGTGHSPPSIFSLRSHTARPNIRTSSVCVRRRARTIQVTMVPHPVAMVQQE